ncbi:hypothetical protein C5167_039273 [Papaver somniferum]|uniref:Uncharacterized protein n=1 Tax=Papaver somniferum TaxID=3469 RepID=A0A4Y7IE51_PAPSO|nr:hypothetical protein C5167_039273 [Papaver somniferum]
MNRRIRSKSSSPKREEGYHRYLKPGALAQIRDSRAKSQISLFRVSASKLGISAASVTSAAIAAAQNHQISAIASTEGFPCFTGRIFNPRCPQRKKLVAPRSFSFLISSSNPSSPVLSDSNNPLSIMDLISADLLVSH